MNNPDRKVKRLLSQAADLDTQARELRIQAGQILHKHGPRRWNQVDQRAYGISSEHYANLLVEMYLRTLADKARPAIPPRKPAA